ncbi:hypothetical protein V3C99_017349 [Haemonchus contortus]
MIIFSLVLVVQISHQQTYIENPTYPPHGCKNFGLCANPTEVMVNSFFYDEYYYTCATEDCVCNNGTSGPACSIVEDLCVTLNPCPDVGGSRYKCTPGIGTYKCECAVGYTGSNCDQDMASICKADTCLNGGNCTTTDNIVYTCECPTGYVGSRCQNEDPCISTNCLNNGTCEVLFDGADFLCNCNPYYQQEYCGWSKLVWTDEPELEGCFARDPILNDTNYYKRITQPWPMSVTKCRKALQAETPTYTMFTLSGDNCYLSNSSYLNSTQYAMESWPCKQKCRNSSEICGDGSSRAIVYTHDTGDFDPNACEDRSLCNADLDQGVCVDMATVNGGYKCKCNPSYTGSNCETERIDPCTINLCSSHGQCVSDRTLWTSRCECDIGWAGEFCQNELKCMVNPCLHGGTCKEEPFGTYSCECLQYYTGTHCENVNKCEYANNCVNGTCVPTVDGTIPNNTCTCIPGYEGVYCDQDIDDCASGPCLNGTCTDRYLGYNCSCYVGVTGENCTINEDDCKPYRTADGEWHENRCKTRDRDAECVDGFDEFTCVCSSQWTGDFCDLNALLRDVLMSIYGRVDLEMLPMLEDLLNNPSQIKDMVPFIVGLQESDRRTDISWDYSDLFHWATFEEKPLVLERDLHKWNDVVLGNCFTFNHRLSSLDYKMRSSGIQGGLQVLMRVGSSEYAPWFDTAAILVFIHNKNEYVFSESVRYSAQPDGETLIQVRDTKYTRLAGKYGVCVKDPSEVNAYYYDGMYTTDGCLRSCYQDMIFKECGCMDPRYPVAPNTTTCELARRQCIDDAVEENGDPSDWDSCVCPLPCSNQQYSVEWHRTSSASEPARCLDLSIENCTVMTEDDVLITITLPRLEYQVFEEVPNMDLNRFISNLGGLLGVLMGVCILSFIEVVVLIFRLICIMFSSN